MVVYVVYDRVFEDVTGVFTSEKEADEFCVFANGVWGDPFKYESSSFTVDHPGLRDWVIEKKRSHDEYTRKMMDGTLRR